eukprot:TRINITY_DN18240_c0_g1::TRINITY_DN18240_c0_g1_i1::g.3873::m.3873 TRINITY_DN18240_c0_g1::TRINITY_DN18240_c0_g1_i1::g.3873  ORF type:complete len:107 (-),score=-0.15,GxDLY/PF14607.1/0.095 TRINITY_DN18240_c0_g1_i1:68-388(-)
MIATSLKSTVQLCMNMIMQQFQMRSYLCSQMLQRISGPTFSDSLKIILDLMKAGPPIKVSSLNLRKCKYHRLSFPFYREISSCVKKGVRCSMGMFMDFTFITLAKW